MPEIHLTTLRVIFFTLWVLYRFSFVLFLIPPWLISWIRPWLDYVCMPSNGSVQYIYFWAKMAIIKSQCNLSARMQRIKWYMYMEQKFNKVFSQPRHFLTRFFPDLKTFGKFGVKIWKLTIVHWTIGVFQSGRRSFGGWTANFRYPLSSSFIFVQYCFRGEEVASERNSEHKAKYLFELYIL